MKHNELLDDCVCFAIPDEDANKVSDLLNKENIPYNEYTYPHELMCDYLSQCYLFMNETENNQDEVVENVKKVWKDFSINFKDDMLEPKNAGFNDDKLYAYTEDYVRKNLTVDVQKGLGFKVM